MQLGKEIDKKQFLTWIEALRSGKYGQGRGRLQSGENKFCCLGVACKILIPDEKQYLDSEGLMYGGFPSSQPEDAVPKWLRKINSHFEWLTEVTFFNLNDDHGFTFDEIADLLEAVYIHKVLE